jgi:hypothetical protein
MKYLKKYNESSESESKFDLNFAIAKIKDEFDEDIVIGMFDEEVLEWVDSDWSNDYDSEYDWYVDHHNGEAQDVIINHLINWYESSFGKITDDQHHELNDAIKEEYDCLKY